MTMAAAEQEQEQEQERSNGWAMAAGARAVRQCIALMDAQRVDSPSGGRGLKWQDHGPSRVICGNTRVAMDA